MLLRKVLTIVCLLTTLAITPLFKAPSPPDAINCPFPMGGCELVVGDGEVDVLLVKGNRQHGDAIQEESLLEMLSSAVREEMEVVQSWILDHGLLQDLEDGDH